MPLAPGQVSDGNFKTAQQNGAASFDYPFASSHNDFVTFLAKRTMRVEVGYFRAPVPMSQRNFSDQGIGYLVDVTTPTIIGGTDLLEYTEIYASLPPTQRDYGSATASIQVPFLATILTESAWVLVNLDDQFDAVFVTEYSLNQPLPQLYRTKLLYAANGVGMVMAGYAYNKPPPNGLYLAQNSTSARWMGGIFKRESIYVIPPPITKFTGLPLPP